MARNISALPPPVKSAAQRNQEQRATEAKYQARMREARREAQAQPLRQSLADLFKAAGV